MGFAWPLVVGSHELTAVELDGGGTDKVHLAQREEPAGDAAIPMVDDPGRDRRRAVETTAAGWQVWTLCGRQRSRVGVADALDLFGEDRGRLCQSCWRTVEGWLVAPPPSAGEDDVVRWAVATVLEIGEAMVEGVPVPRLESLRRQIRSELKAAIGGSVRTVKVGPAALWVWSGVVNDAKTSERREEEMRAAAERMWAVDEDRPVDDVRWRRNWSDIIGGG